MTRHKPRQSSEALETARLWLRPYQQGDRDSIVALYGDAEVTAFTKLGRRTAAETEHILAGYLAAWRQLGLGMRAMFLKSAQVPGQAFVGEFGLFAHDKAGGMALRYALAKAYWGQGLATEAARGTLDDAFGAKGLERVQSVVQTRNQASVRVMEKLGFEAQRRAMDGDSEIVFYSLSSAQWREGR